MSIVVELSLFAVGTYRLGQSLKMAMGQNVIVGVDTIQGDLMTGITNRTTLAQYLIEESRVNDDLTPDLVALTLDVAQACKTISRTVAYGSLGSAIGKTAGVNVQGETQMALDEIFRNTP